MSAGAYGARLALARRRRLAFRRFVRTAERLFATSVLVFLSYLFLAVALGPQATGLLLALTVSLPVALILIVGVCTEFRHRQ